MDRNTKHNKAMAKQKAAVDEGIAKADIERGVSILLTGDGKGKTSSAFGMVMRALGYGQKVGVVQFIKGVQASGEENYVRDLQSTVTLPKAANQQSAKSSWAVSEANAKRKNKPFRKRRKN